MWKRWKLISWSGLASRKEKRSPETECYISPVYFSQGSIVMHKLPERLQLSKTALTYCQGFHK